MLFDRHHIACFRILGDVDLPIPALGQETIRDVLVYPLVPRALVLIVDRNTQVWLLMLASLHASWTPQWLSDSQRNLSLSSKYCFA